MMRRSAWILVVGGFSFLGGFAGMIVASHLSHPVVAQTPERDSRVPVVTDLVSISDRFELVARKVSPAVVYVEARKPNGKSGASAKTVEDSGSGVLVRLEGRREHVVLTNNHVIGGAEADQIIVQLGDGRVFRPVRVWRDPESDVGVLALPLAENLPAAPLGDSDKMRVGNWVLAIGSPFGLNQTVTHGILSARQRGQISLGSTIRIKDFLQTDAAINPGSSGGPLVNLDGEVIGINTAIASPSGNNSGVAFSIPINLFRRVADQLITKGTVSRGYLGVQLSQTFEPADALRAGLDRHHGALVEAVYPNTPAAAAGLRVGDIILEIDGLIVRNENELINHISGLAAGKTVQLAVWRERRRVAITAVVGDWSDGKDRIPPPAP